MSDRRTLSEGFLYKLLCFTLITLFINNCTLFGGNNSNPNNTTSPPNVVFILADDLGWADLPSYGNKFNEAPNIDQLAEQGMKFTNAYAPYPICTPSRASILTGRYSARMGIHNVFPAGQAKWKPYEKVITPINRTFYLPLEQYTMGELMNDAGYRTGYFGKWHLGFNNKHYPSSQGYEESVVFKGGGYYNLDRRLFPPQNVPDDKPLPEVLADLGIDFIENNKKDSFFLTLSFYEPHLPLDAEKSLIEKFEAKEKVANYTSNPVYAAQIKMLDRAVGRIQEKLKQEKLLSNTVIIFYSDNGGFSYRAPMNENGASKSHYNPGQLVQSTSNKPLREGKGTLYEGGIRVPLIIKWPNVVEEGSVSESPVSGVDLFPTFAEIGGYGLSKVEGPIDGKSLIPLIEGKANYERSLFWHYPVYRRDVPASVIRKGNWKLIQFLDDRSVELYNMANDVAEPIDLAAQKEKKVEELRNLLIEWRERIGADMPEPNSNFDPDRRDIRKKDPRDPRY